jgi:sodium transport system ATP-binding protein
MNTSPAIVVDNVVKSYGKNAPNIIRGVSFTVAPGEIYGLLGPNGAGKTTLMQMISTLSRPSSGSISICGMDSVKDALEIHKKIGFLTTEIKLDPLSTPDKLYDLFASLYSIPEEEAKIKKDVSFETFGITPFADKKIVELSTGMKQKVSIAISLIHEPPVIIFDEPTNGLDILTSKQVTDYLLELKAQGRAIILSTHIFQVAEELCDRIGMLVDGKIAAEGTQEELMKLAGKDRFEDAFFTIYKENHHES